MTTYRDAGVDIDAAESAKSRIKEYVRGTFTKDSVLDAGFFCGGIRLDMKHYRDPVLMLGNDGVGTKMVVARMMNRYDTVGFDIVNHCANDLLASGARPLFFLDYIASERIVHDVASEIVRGVADACRSLGVVLVGGETAQLPGVYVSGETDVAGCMGGIVERSEIIDGKRIGVGDVLVGIASSGLHTNGYSLARKILFDELMLDVDSHVSELGGKLGDVLLVPHREYVNTVLDLRRRFDVRGIAHITGGGITDNIPRILPEGLGAEVRVDAWDIPALFRFLEQKGNVPKDDLMRAFNMGIGIILVFSRDDAVSALMDLRRMKEKAWLIGEVVKGRGVSYVKG